MPAVNSPWKEVQERVGTYCITKQRKRSKKYHIHLLNNLLHNYLYQSPHTDKERGKKREKGGREREERGREGEEGRGRKGEKGREEKRHICL